MDNYPYNMDNTAEGFVVVILFLNFKPQIPFTAVRIFLEPYIINMD